MNIYNYNQKSNFSNTKMTTYKQAFDIINVNISDRIKEIIKILNNEGYNERSISYSIWKSKEKLMSYRFDDRFYSILMNEVRKIAYKNK